MPVGLLQREQRAGCRLDAALASGERRSARRMSAAVTVLITSILSHAADEIGRPIAGPDRTFDGRRQSGLGPIAGEEQDCATPWRRRALGILAGVAAKVARRSRTICHGGNASGRPATVATSFQISSPALSRGTSSRRSPALMVTDRRSGNANSHSTVPFTTPMMGARPAGGSTRKWPLTMARNSVGASSRARDPPPPPAAPPGSPRRRRRSRACRRRNRAPRRCPREFERAAGGRTALARRARRAQRRLDEDAAQSVASDQRPAGLRPPGSRE